MSSYRDYDNSALMQFVRWISKSFRVGDFFAVHVRMYWVAAVLVPLILWRWVPVGTFVEGLVLTAIAFVMLFVVIWAHEMGHIAAGWRYRIRTDLITLSPLGGIAHMNAPVQTPREEIVVSLAGPATHLLWLAVFWPLELVLPERVIDVSGWAWCPIVFTVWYLVWLNTSLLLFNLLPFFPLDGGRVLRAVLSLKVHPNRATLWATTVGMIGGGLIVFFALTRVDLESSIGVLLGLTCIFACLGERKRARYAHVYHEARRDPWAMDPDAWKRGAGPLADPRRKREPGRLRRWLQARDQRKAQQAAMKQAALDREVDAVLDRVNEVGMTGLTDAERAVLKRASQRRRGVG